MKIFYGFMLVVISMCSCSGEWQSKATKTGKVYAEIKTSMGTMVVELMPEIAPKTVENFIGLAEGTKEWTDPKTGKKEKKPFYNGLIFHRVIKDFMIQGGCPNGNGSGGPGYSFEDEIYDKSASTVIKGKIENEDLARKVFEDLIVPNLRSPKPDKELMAIVQECQKERSGKPIMKHPVEFYLNKIGRKEPLMSDGTLKAKVEYGTLCMANSGPNTNGSQFFIVTRKEGADYLNGRHTVFGKVVKGMEVADKISLAKTAPGDKPEKEVKISKINIYQKKK